MTIQIPALPSKLQKIRTEIHALSQQERRVLLQALLAEESSEAAQLKCGNLGRNPTLARNCFIFRFVVPVEPPIRWKIAWTSQRQAHLLSCEDFTVRRTPFAEAN